MKRQNGSTSTWVALMRITAIALLLSGSSLVLADPAREGDEHCAVSSQGEARLLADLLYQQGAYQRAGECYQTAGDSERANLAFTKAVGPASAQTAQRASGQAEKAKAVVQRYKLALHLE